MSVGLRERKKLERRAALIDAAQALALDHGIEAVTVEAICEAVDVAPRTFFNYFRSKEEALLTFGSFATPQEAQDVFVAGGPTGSLLPDLAALAQAVLARALEDSERVERAVALVQRYPELAGRYAAWIERHRHHVVELARARLGPDDPHAEVVGHLVGAIIMLVGERHARKDAGLRAHVSVVVGQLRAVLAS